MLEYGTKNLARSEEQLHLLCQILALTLGLLTFLVDLFEIAQDNSKLQTIHCRVQVIDKYIIWYTET